MLIEKEYVLILAFVHTEVAIGAIAPVCERLFSKQRAIKLVLAGPERFNLKKKVPFFLHDVTILAENLSKSDLTQCRAIIITDLPKPQIAHATTYTVSHGSIPHKYNEHLWAVSDVYFGQFDAEEQQLRKFLPDPRKEFVVAGTPKQDPKIFGLSYKSNHEPDIRQETSGHMKVVAVNSHWSRNGLIRTFNGEIFKLLYELSQELAFKLVAHLHPKIIDETLKDSDYNKSAAKEAIANIKQLGIDLSIGGQLKFLREADIIVGDCSSIMAQASLSNADIVCFRPERIPIPEFDADFRKMIHEFSDMATLRANILTCLETPNSKASEKSSFSKKYILNTAQPAELIAEKIIHDVDNR